MNRTTLIVQHIQQAMCVVFRELIKIETKITCWFKFVEMSDSPISCVVPSTFI